jgi:hypothetical protein
METSWTRNSGEIVWENEHVDRHKATYNIHAEENGPYHLIVEGRVTRTPFNIEWETME